MTIFIIRQGLFFGQCSELCGSGHLGMPIVAEALLPFDFFSYYEDNYWINFTKKSLAPFIPFLLSINKYSFFFLDFYLEKISLNFLINYMNNLFFFSYNDKVFFFSNLLDYNYINFFFKIVIYAEYFDKFSIFFISN